MLGRPDSLSRPFKAGQPPDTLRVPLGRGGGKRDIETTIVYSARDSIRLDAPGKVAYLYGDADITYGTTHLTAALVRIEYGRNVVTAEGAPDSAGVLQNTPIFTDKGEQYEAKKIAYNFKTKKGKISEAITKQGEGYIHAESVKRVGEKELYGLHGQYTTCELPHPHFYINASKMKVVPGEKIVTGPFNLVIGDVPTPLGFLFGYFPTPKTRSSGIIIPSYGETPSRGFQLLGGGYYWAASPYVGVRLTGDFFTLGGWTARADVQYRRRYRYDGTFQVSYARAQPTDRIGAGADLNASRVVRAPDATALTWTHNPVARPGHGSFRANVQINTGGFYRQQPNTTVQNALATQFNSGVSYSGAIRDSPFNYNISAQQGQTVNPATNVTTMNFTAPTVSLGMAQQTPLRWLALRTGKRVFNNLTVGYNLAGTNQFGTVRSTRDRISGLLGAGERDTTINLRVGQDGLGAILRNGTAAVQHSLSIGLGTYSLAHLNFSPGVSYGESWTFARNTYTYDPVAQGVRIDRERGFYRVYRYSYSLSATTRLYGLLRLPRTSRVEAVRLTLNPDLSYSYTPDFGAARFGFYQTGVRTDASERTTTLARVAGAPGVGRSSAVGLRLSSNLEAKVRPGKGDTATTSRKVQLIQQMSVATSYNLAADSFNLAPLSANLNTQLFGLVNLNMSAQLDPYQRDSSGRRLPRYLLEAPRRPRLARLANAALQMSFSFNSQQRARGGANPNQQAAQAAVPGLPIQPTGDDPGLPPVLMTGPQLDYVTFELPWTLNLGYGLNYTAPGPRGRVAGQPLLSTGTITTNGSVRLTPKWAITYNLPFDTRTKTLVAPTFTINRDLHCWNLSVYWIPVGQLQSYNVTLRVNSRTLQDLKLVRNRQWTGR